MIEGQKLFPSEAGSGGIPLLARENRLKRGVYKGPEPLKQPCDTGKIHPMGSDTGFNLLPRVP
jgi:hypothetical protein